MKQDIPHNRADVLDGSNRFTRDWYDYFRRIKPVSAPTNVQQTVINNSQFLPPVTSASGYEEGSSFPSSPASGDKFYRTDLNWLCFYDGTRWLTVHEYCQPIAIQDVLLPRTVGTLASVGYLPVRQDYDLYLTTLTITSLTIAPNSGSAYWNFALRYKNSSNVATTITSLNTSTHTAGVATDASVAINSPLNTAAMFLDFTVQDGAGSPGASYVFTAVNYRLIVT